MARLSSRAVFIVALVLLSVAVAGCGGGSSSTSTTESTGGPASESSTSSAQPLPGHPKIAAKPSHHHGSAGAEGGRYGSFTRASAAAAERKAERRQRSAHRRLARKAGKAAPFLVKEGDNSIPTYGSEAAASVHSEAERVLSGYLQARESENWPTACAAMSAQLVKQVALLSGKTGCATASTALAEKGSAAERADPMVGGIVSLRVESPHAFALFYGSGKQQYMMPLEEDGGGWTVTQIAPLPWPIGR
jgi:hypothetical protein